MAKRTSSFNLEQDIYQEIEDYKNAHNLSSRNVALERMLLERRILLMQIGLNNQNNSIANLNNISDSKSVSKVSEKKKKSKLEMSIEHSFDEMPD